MVTSAAGIVSHDQKRRGNGFNSDWCQLFFLQLRLIFYVILHVNWPVESIIKSHGSSACAFENLDDVISIISDHLLCFLFNFQSLQLSLTYCSINELSVYSP